MSDTPPPSPQPPDEKRIKAMREEYGLDKTAGDFSMGELAGTGVELAATVGVFTALGWWIDTKLGSTPWALLLCCAVGLSAGMYRLVKRFARFNK